MPDYRHPPGFGRPVPKGKPPGTGRSAGSGQREVPGRHGRAHPLGINRAVLRKETTMMKPEQYILVAEKLVEAVLQMQQLVDRLLTADEEHEWQEPTYGKEPF